MAKKKSTSKPQRRPKPSAILPDDEPVQIPRKDLMWFIQKYERHKGIQCASSECKYCVPGGNHCGLRGVVLVKGICRYYNPDPADIRRKDLPKEILG